tara:strand:+ start:29968 stop:30750 length:783 start_codon:yes stop_codon:yes gene_type:complete
MSASKGVLLLYTENNSLDYKRLANLSARLAKHYLNVPATIVKIDPVKKNTRVFRYDDGTETMEWNNIGRYSAYDLSPYDETLLIDTDYFIQNNNLGNYFETPNTFLCHNNSWDISGNDVFRHDQFLENGGNGFEMRWATVVFFKKSIYAKQIFDTWRVVYENYKYYSRLFGFSETPFRNDFALSIAHQICNGYKNTNTFKHRLPALSTTDTVLNYGNCNWLIKYKFKQSYNVVRYKGDLHVMNKRCILHSDLYSKLWNSV